MARMRAAERKQQLLHVAAELFAQRGYRGVTTAELAAAAGVTEPILYRHFQNKLDLFVTLIQGVSDIVIREWQQVLARQHTPTARLRALLEHNPATHERGRGIYRVIFQAMTEGETEPAIADAINDHVMKLHRFLKHELRALQKDGIIRTDEPPAALAGLLIDVAIGYGMISGLTGEPSRLTGRKTIQRLVEELITA